MCIYFPCVIPFVECFCVRWREGGAVHAPGAALPAPQQQAAGPRGGDCRHAAVGGAGLAEIRGGVQGHDRHPPGHGEASASLLRQEVASSTVSRAFVRPDPDTAGIRLLPFAGDISLTYYPQGRSLSSTKTRAEAFMSRQNWLTFFVWPIF